MSLKPLSRQPFSAFSLYTTLSDTLIPDAQNAELKALLQSGLGVFQAHQKHAEQLASELQSGSASQ